MKHHLCLCSDHAGSLDLALDQLGLIHGTHTINARSSAAPKGLDAIQNRIAQWSWRVFAQIQLRKYPKIQK